MLRKNIVLLLIVIPMVLMLGAGCSKHKARPIEISQGEYYEDEEYQKLSKKDREAYCIALAEGLENLKVRSEEAEIKLTENKKEIRNLTKELRDAERQYSTLTTQINELTRQKEELEALPKSWVLQYGECLWVVAGYEEIYGDPIKWPRLWRGNKVLVEDPDWVLAGWELKVPRTWPKRHMVVQDEWLARIAGYWEVYDNYREWPLLFEANKGRIQDPDLIFPEQELVIPR
jgi:nucleoid-associated protein YgaU